MDPEAMPSRGQPRSLVPLVLLGAGVFVFVQAFEVLSPILLSFLLVMLISLAVNPLISRMRASRMGRKVAVGLVTAGFLVLMALTGWGFIGPMKDAFVSISEQLPAYWERMQRPLIQMEKKAERSESRLQAEIEAEHAGDPNAEFVPETLPAAPPLKTNPLRKGLGEMLRSAAGGFSSVAMGTAQWLFVFTTVFVGVLFTLMDPRPMVGALFRMIPETHHPQTLIILRRIAQFVPHWAGATFLGMGVIGLMVFFAMWPLFGFQDALVLGLIAGVLEAIPYLGPLLGSVPAFLLAFGEGGQATLWVMCAYFLIQFLENNLILPLIMARGVRVHPVAVIFSMLLSVAAFGVLGMLVATPLVAIAKILHEELFQKRFLPNATDKDIERLARKALLENSPSPV